MVVDSKKVADRTIQAWNTHVYIYMHIYVYTNTIPGPSVVETYLWAVTRDVEEDLLALNKLFDLCSAMLSRAGLNEEVDFKVSSTTCP